MHHLRDVQALNKVISDDVGGSNDHIVNVLHTQSQKQTFLSSLKWVLGASIVPDHLVIPKANIKVTSLLFRGLQSLNYTRVHQVATQLEVDNDVVELGLTSV